MSYILSVDQNTSATKTVVFNLQADMFAIESIEHHQFYPQAEWVEHDPMEI